MNGDRVSETVEDSETLARFVLFSGHVRQNATVKADAFMPPKNLQLSVTRHVGLSEIEIWGVGQGVANLRIPPAILRGRADVSAIFVRKSKLDVVCDEPPKNHANIIGWPADKPSQKMLAQLLAAGAAFVSNPQ